MPDPLPHPSAQPPARSQARPGDILAAAVLPAAAAALPLAAESAVPRFALDDVALEAWLSELGDEADEMAPAVRSVSAGAELADLLAAAIDRGVLVGPLEVSVIEQDGEEPGFYVVIRGRRGELGLTSTFQPLRAPAGEAAAAARVRNHLDRVCVVANGILVMAAQLAGAGLGG